MKKSLRSSVGMASTDLSKAHMPVAARKTNVVSLSQLGDWNKSCSMLHFIERQSLEARSLAFQSHRIKIASLLKGRQWLESAHCLPSRHGVPK